MRRLLLTVALAALPAPALLAQTATASPTLHWGPAPAVFPRGAQMAVVSGDPSKAVLFTIELKMPGGYRIPPHFHPTDEHVAIIAGNFLVGMGDKLDLKQTRAMAVGDTGTVPAHDHHFAVAKVATVVSVTAMGPFAMTYVHPEDDPQHAKPAGY
jgi:quercetin dioxygenase-like cupin family protein